MSYPKSIVTHGVGKGEKRFRIVDKGVKCGLPVHKSWVCDCGGAGSGAGAGGSHRCHCALLLPLLDQAMKLEDGETRGTARALEPRTHSGKELEFIRAHFDVCGCSCGFVLGMDYGMRREEMLSAGEL